MRKYIPTLLAVLLAALTSVNATAAGNYYLFVSDANGQTAQSIEMHAMSTAHPSYKRVHNEATIDMQVVVRISHDGVRPTHITRSVEERVRYIIVNLHIQTVDKVEYNEHDRQKHIVLLLK